MPKRNQFTGKRFGKRVILGPASFDKHGRQLWNFKCDCGHSATCRAQDLIRLKNCLKCGHKGPRPYRRLRPFESLYNVVVARAKRRGTFGPLTYEQFVVFTQETECHYCGSPIAWGPGWRDNTVDRMSASNLDRKDSAKPYSKDNVVVCCRRCNIGKNEVFSYDEWRQIGALMRTWAREAAS